MAEECKFFLGESGQFKFVPSGSIYDEASDVEMKEDKLNLDYSSHMKPFISGEKSIESSVVCYPDVKSESQVNARKEFDDLRVYEETVILPTKSFVESKKEANSYCNRYINVLPCIQKLLSIITKKKIRFMHFSPLIIDDDNFVTIKPVGVSTGYVNASYIPVNNYQNISIFI